VVVSGFPIKCYKTHTCSGGQRQKGGGREAMEGCVHREREIDGGGLVRREGGAIARFID